MFSQSFCLPNKKQSMFVNQSPQSMGLLRNFSKPSYQDSADHIPSLDFQVPKKDIKSFSQRTSRPIMDLVNSFTETQNMSFDRRYLPTFYTPTERSKLNCKEVPVMTHCRPNTMTSLPFARSYVVGGFVGSKSQLGRRRKNYVGKTNLWDIIRDIVELSLFCNTSENFSEKQNPQSSSSFGKKCCIQNSYMEEQSSHNNFTGMNWLEEPTSSLSQSYADVAKRSSRDHCKPVKIPQCEDQPCVQSSKSCNKPKSVIEPIVSSCNSSNFSHRDRIASECSADSEDSFIVFELCEDENIDKDIESSDDESCSYFDEVSQSDSGIVPSTNSSFCNKPSSKKVRFAEGKSLVKVHPLVTWNFAYKMARKGPWEMLARDTERFKLRIARTEAVLKPILDPQHRSVVFRDRFADSVR